MEDAYRLLVVVLCKGILVHVSCGSQEEGRGIESPQFCYFWLLLVAVLASFYAKELSHYYGEKGGHSVTSYD